MPNNYLAVLQDIDGKENLVALYGAKEVEELITLIEKDTTYSLISIQQINRFLSLHDFKNIIQ